jgi:hypothetical protein
LLGFCTPERADALDRHLRAYMGLKELP